MSLFSVAEMFFFSMLWWWLIDAIALRTRWLIFDAEGDYVVVYNMRIVCVVSK